MHDDYARGGGGGGPDFDSRNGGPANKRQRIDALNDGHWANAPTDRRGGGFQSMGQQGPHWRPNNNNNNNDPQALDETLTAARHGVSPFFQTATDEELKGLSRTLRVFQK